jgi:hypothetical protein
MTREQHEALDRAVAHDLGLGEAVHG